MMTIQAAECLWALFSTSLAVGAMVLAGVMLDSWGCRAAGRQGRPLG